MIDKFLELFQYAFQIFWQFDIFQHLADFSQSLPTAVSPVFLVKMGNKISGAASKIIKTEQKKCKA